MAGTRALRTFSALLTLGAALAAPASAFASATGEAGAGRTAGAVGASRTAGAAGAVPAGQAQGAAAGKVVRDEITLELDKSGLVRVTEKAVVEGAGFERALVTRTRLNDEHDRLYKISNIRLTRGQAAVKPEVDVRGDSTVIRAPGSGRQEYTLKYDVSGVVAPVPGGEELRWHAGGGWAVPAEAVKVKVTGPAPVQSVNCFAGHLDSAVGCTGISMEHTGLAADFEQGKLAPGEVMTVIVGYPSGATGARPLLERRWTFQSAFTLNWVTGGALLGLVAVLLGGVGLLVWTRGRDERVVGAETRAGDHAPISRDGGRTEFAPPDGVRPGQIGTLLDEQADVVDVTATIVDLAVRGYLMIEEQPRRAYDAPDWKLVRNPNAPVGALLPYEAALYDAIFDGRGSVLLSQLHGSFANGLGKVRDELYDDVVRQGWFARRPDAVRTRWTTIGLVIAVLGIAVTVALAWFTTYGLLGLALIIAGAALAVGGQYMPARTAKGAAALAHTLGFRDYLFHGRVEDVPADKRVELFSRYLPYAVVFDNVDHWARCVAEFSGNGAEADHLYWYHGPAEWDLSRFADSMRTFTTTTSGAISAARALRS
ncbi:DUF2207 domain-containing protein [Bailinhaonella thermotolerans]|uniref:DUF2207 domain-containing protein n=1 Tax=Bailinhaonella thermotolerans TaxID=1070861 RepID=A0A3A4AP91_9ACTN|nr:DUF2207 domain-containing protein [Bailinhaonella thermotolerans]RJL30841.1 DUF2207 domain-containing protein [Bailinhaonella thermotolerans]